MAERRAALFFFRFGATMDASEIADLKTIRSQAIARLKDITKEPKPSYSVDGQAVQWSAYHRMLVDQISSMNTLIGSEEDTGIEQIQAFT